MAKVGSGTSARQSAPEQQLQQLQIQASETVLPVLYLVAALLFLFSWLLPNPHVGVIASLLLWLLVVAVWALRRWRAMVSSWTLVLGCLVVVLLVTLWGQAGSALLLMQVPVGLAAVALGWVHGAVLGVTCTVLVVCLPEVMLPANGALRFMALVGIWSTYGLMWLWTSQEQGRLLLGQARDRQVQLKQSLADLADANQQLTRLNRLVHGLRQAAEEANRSKAQFVANVSHELRTPLNMIIGYSEMIVRAPQVYGKRVPAALLADLGVILRNSEHLSELIDDVLDLSQIQAGKMALTREWVMLAEGIEAAATAVRPLFSSKGLELQVEVRGDLPALLCDRTRVREVVLNLLSNAARFTDSGGVRLVAWQDGGQVYLSVTDSGPGIAPEEQAKLFQPFQQLDGSLGRRHGGTGLGLNISKSIIDLHGGRMWVESEPGRGATFSFCLPIEPPELAGDNSLRWFRPDWHYEERLGPSMAPAPTLRPRFIVVEAAPNLERLLTRYWDDTQVVAVADMEAAKVELAREPAQAILVNQPSVAGVLQSLEHTDLLDGTPVMVCSLPGLHEAANALGATDYLVKPISQEVLIAALMRLGVQAHTVLVVEDEPEAAQLFQRMLAFADTPCRTLRATTGRQALDIMRQHPVDVVLLDLAMPDMDGYEVLRLRSGGLSVPQLLACVRALSSILLPAACTVDPEPQERRVA